MKSIAAVSWGLKKVKPGLFKPGFVKAASFVIVACVLAIAQSSPKVDLPQVHLDADGLAPRPIEELTGTTIARHYALAWRDLAEALESDRSGRIDEEFVGFAKDRITHRIAEQEQ